MQRVSAVEAQLGNEVTVFVAKTDIQPRQPLKPEQFEAVEVPQKFVQQSTVTNLNKINEFVTIVPLKKGDVLDSNLLKPAKELGTSGNKRLVYVPASDRIVFDQPLNAQDRADIIVSWGGDDGSKRTVIFDTDVLVAAAVRGGRQIFGSLAGDDPGRGEAVHRCPEFCSIRSHSKGAPRKIQGKSFR